MRNYKYISFLMLVVILVAASYLRLYRISEYMTFLGDEGRDVLVVKRIIVDHILTLLGPTASVGGFFLGPIYYYFMIPFLWLWKLDPTGPAVMVALFGIATTYMVYRVGRDFFEPMVGYIAGSLYAVSPLVIAHSRSSWNPNLVPFFSILLMYTLWTITLHKRYKYFFIVGLILGIGLQLHYLFVFLFFSVFLWVIIFFRKWNMISYFALAVFGFLISYSPFILFELRHEFLNSTTLIRFLQEGKDTGFTLITFTTNIFDVTFRSFARLIFRYPTDAFLVMLPVWKRFIWNSVIFGSIGLSIFFVFMNLLKHMKSKVFYENQQHTKNKISTILIVLWFIIPIVLFGFYKRAIYDYYLGIIFPIPFILMGLVLIKIFSYRWGAIFASAVWFILLLVNWSGRPFVYTPNNQLGQTKNIAKAALDKTEGKPFNFALITGSNSDHAYRYFFEIWGYKPVSLENFTVDPERKTVTNQLIVICEIQDCQPLGHSLWEVAGFGRADIASESFPPGVDFVKIYKLVHYNEL